MIGGTAPDVAVAPNPPIEPGLLSSGSELLVEIVAGAKLVMGAGSCTFADVFEDDKGNDDGPPRSVLAVVLVARMGTDAGSLSTRAVSLAVTILKGAPRRGFGALQASVVGGTLARSSGELDVTATSAASSCTVCSAGVCANCLVGDDDTLIRGLLVADTAFVDS